MTGIEGLLNKINFKDVSDIHIKVGACIRVRTNGDLVEVGKEILTYEAVEEYIKELLKDKYKEFLENGEIDCRYSRNESEHFRINVFKVLNGYSICMRIIKSDIPQVSDLTDSNVLKELTELKEGLVIVTGPTGSGKSTTIAAIVNEINKTKKKHIITLEEPIEFVYKNEKSIINQREIGNDTKSYSLGLKSALRQDPDIIVLGEMRDKETIEVALRAAQTGHLVFSTLHNMGAVNSIYRIINSFEVLNQSEIKLQLSSLLRAVISQVLLNDSLGSGRIAAMEIMLCTPSIKNLIREGNYEQINSFIQMGSKFGMKTMEMDLRNLVNKKIISIEEYKSWIEKL